MSQKPFDPNTLNTDDLVLWFDDLGSGNEQYNFLSNFYEGEPITLSGVTWSGLMDASLPEDPEDTDDAKFNVQCDVLRGMLYKKGIEWSLAGMIPGKEDTDQIRFRTGEHAFAAMKFWGSDWTHFFNIVFADDKRIPEPDGSTYFLSAPNHAKSLGRSRNHPIREDWESMKLDVMAAVTRAKYAFGREEAGRLLATGDRLLVEGTMWQDEVWGVDLFKEGMPGRNWLGTLLMARRAELRVSEVFGENTSSRTLDLSESVGTHNSEWTV